MGKELLGKKVKAAYTGKEMPILPASFCDVQKGTGIVTSVPSDAPDDYIGLRDLQTVDVLITKYKLDKNVIMALKPIPMIVAADLGENAAVKVVEDMKIKAGTVQSMGDLAQYILDKRIPLEICLTSNVHTGAVKKLEDHPFGILYRYKFRVMLNTDDRLMSKITLSDEFKHAADTFHLKIDDLEKLTINAMKSAFMPYKKRIALIYDVIKPGFARARAKLARS